MGFGFILRVKQRAAHLLELHDFRMQLFLARFEFCSQAGDTEEDARAAVDELFRQGDLVVRQYTAAGSALMHRSAPGGTDTAGNHGRE